MEQLSGLDNASLVSEKGNVFSHVCTLLVYDVTTAPGAKVRYKDILQHFEERLHLHPVFSNRLATVPFGIDRPYWVAGCDIDLEYHIRHIALPGEQQTGTAASAKPARKRPKMRQVKTTARAKKSSPARKTAASRNKSTKK